jgi:hypothetical protein
MVCCPTQFLEGGVEFAFGGQGNGAGVAAFQADFAAGETAKGMRHEWPAGFGVPFKDIVRAEVEALQVRAAEVRVNGGKPRKFLTKIIQQGHSYILYASHV